MIKLDWTLFVQLAIFLSFVAYLNHMLLKPMKAYLDRRSRTIEGLRSTGGDQESQLARLQEEYSAKINAAREDMLSQRSAARKEVVDIQSSILDEARKESHKDLSRAEDELAADVRAAKEALARDARALASSISSKVLGRTLS